MALKFFPTELFKKIYWGGFAPPPTKIGLTEEFRYRNQDIRLKSMILRCCVDE